MDSVFLSNQSMVAAPENIVHQNEDFFLRQQEFELKQREFQLKLDEQKASFAQKEREFELKLKDQLETSAQKEREFQLRLDERKMARWTNPLVIAVVGTGLAVAGNAAVNYCSNEAQNTLERQKADHDNEAQLRRQDYDFLTGILKTGDPERALDNLKFLANVPGIISEPLRLKLLAYIDKSKSRAPVLPREANFNFSTSQPSRINDLRAIAVSN